jgi:hypothetical protein
LTAQRSPALMDCGSLLPLWLRQPAAEGTAEESEN